MRIYDISLFVFIFVTILGALNAMEVARSDEGWYIFGEPAGVSVNASMVNATEMVGQVMPENSTLSYYQALAESWLGIPIRAVNVVGGFFKVALFMGFYLQELIPFIPTELAWAINVLVGVPWAIGLIQIISGRVIER